MKEKSEQSSSRHSFQRTLSQFFTSLPEIGFFFHLSRNDSGMFFTILESLCKFFLLLFEYIVSQLLFHSLLSRKSHVQGFSVTPSLDSEIISLFWEWWWLDNVSSSQLLQEVDFLYLLCFVRCFASLFGFNVMINVL